VLPLLLYSSFIIGLALSLWILKPFNIVLLDRFYGDQAISPQFFDWFAMGMYLLEIIFILYPGMLLITRGRQMRSPIASKALPTLAVAWSGVGFVLLFFNGVLRIINIEIVDIGNLISASLFASTMLYFRRISLLESLFETPTIESEKIITSNPFSGMLRLKHHNILNRKILFEIDTSGRYEEVVKNFVEETIGNLEITIVFTRKGSPIYNSIKSYEGIRFFFLTPQISYPKHGDRETEMLLPVNDNSILLSALDKALKASVNKHVSIVFDNLSDMIISQGMEKTYNFLKYALEVMSRPDTSALFLMISESHESKIVSIIRGLFDFHVVQKNDDIKIVKAI
jgi:hypothetical protein